MVQTSAGLISYCKDFLDKHAANDVALGDEDVLDFFRVYSFERLMSTFTQGHLDATAASTVVDTLRKLLDAPMGGQVLHDAAPYLCAACSSPLQPLRRMAVQQLARLLAPTFHTDAAQQQLVCTQLVLQLGDADTGVAADAESALAAWVLQQGGGIAAARALLLPSEPLGALVHALARGEVPPSSTQGQPAVGQGPVQPPVRADLATCQARVLALALQVVSHGGQQVEAVLQQSGLLQPILSAVQGAQADPLSAMSCLAQLQQVAAGSGSATLPVLLHDQLLPLLEPLLSDSLLGPSAMAVSAALLRSSLDSQPAAAPAPDLSTHTLTLALKAALDEAGNAPPDAEAAALEALGILTQSRRGAEALLLCPGAGSLLACVLMTRALQSAHTPDLRVAALHAAATLAGAERVHEYGERRAALISEAAEALLREATFASCSGTSVHTPSEALLELLSSPFTEQRGAVYRFIAAMAVRPWFAAEVVRNASLLSRITSAASESGSSMPQAGEAAGVHVKCAQWRHAAVESLWLTAKQAAAGTQPTGAATTEAAAHTSALGAALSALTASLQAGPHGVYGKGAPAGVHEHQIATLP